MTPIWQQIPNELGHRLWGLYRVMFGETPRLVGCGASCTEDKYVETEVWTDDGRPLLRCRSRYPSAVRDENDVLIRGEGEHHFAIPKMIDDAADMDLTFVDTDELRAELAKRGES